MKPGDVVRIYQDPVTKQDYEGLATLKEEYNNDGECFSMWWVIFDNEPNNEYMRTIYTPPSE